MNSRSKRTPDLGACRLVSVTPIGEGVIRLTLLDPEGGRHPITVSEGAWREAGSPGKNTDLDGTVTANLIALSNRREAVRHALHILSYGDNSERTLTQKLRRLECTEEEIAYAIALVKRHGYLSEDDGCYRMADACIRRGYSRRKCEAYLFGKGYSREVIHGALTRLAGEGLADFEANRARFIEEKQKKGMTPEQIRAALYRAGF